MKLVILLLAALLLAGCGIKQQVVRVNVPDVRVNPASGPEVVVAKVTDDRPTSYLSLYPKATWQKNVGGTVRSGNGFNLVLESSSVTHKVHEIIVQSLRSMGYRTVVSCSGPCLQLQASVHTFAASIPFNFWRAVSWTQHMVAKLSVKVSLERDNNSTSFTVSGNGDNIFQALSQENWETAFDRAVHDFVSNFKQAMVSHQLSPSSKDQAPQTIQPTK